MNLKKLSIFLFIFFITTKLAEEKIYGHQYNLILLVILILVMMENRLTLIGFQHQNENLNRDTFLEIFHLLLVVLLLKILLAYIYTGFEWNMNMGSLTFTPSFAPGLYHEGNGKDLDMFLNLNLKFNFLMNPQKTQ